MDLQSVSIPVGEEKLTGLFLRPDNARALYLFAHGAGTNMAHPSMASNADGLAKRGIATLRYNFLYTQKGGKRPDPPKLAHAAVRAAARTAVEIAPDLPLFAGGRSFGGRMTSQAQSEDPLPAVRGLAFLGFPLHPAGKPGTDRADHLEDVRVPMLFVSGTKDALAELELLKPVVAGLGERATLHLVDQADHSFKVAAKSGRTNAEAEADALDAMAEWILKLE
ncbi:MAG TPA: alpha/beta family hydrolase [Sphingomicrobium sp.]|nr:alpha/beta family hydrolase [Sphingomicrobium sp.]